MDRTRSADSTQPVGVTLSLGLGGQLAMLTSIAVPSFGWGQTLATEQHADKQAPWHSQASAHAGWRNQHVLCAVSVPPQHHGFQCAQGLCGSTCEHYICSRSPYLKDVLECLFSPDMVPALLWLCC